MENPDDAFAIVTSSSRPRFTSRSEVRRMSADSTDRINKGYGGFRAFSGRQIKQKSATLEGRERP
jgi:hypothetical protein